MTMFARVINNIVMAMAMVCASFAAAQSPQPPEQPAIDVQFDAQEISRIYQHSPLPAPPADNNRFADHPGASRLGQFLFFDPRLSGNGKISCSTCHDPSHGFADGKPVAEGMGKGQRNTLSLWNVAYNRWFFWDGRADSLWSQALKPIEHSTELGGNRLHTARLIRNDPDLQHAYQQVFGEFPAFNEPAAAAPPSDNADAPHGPTDILSTLSADDQLAVNNIYVNVGKSIAAYERQLVSTRAPFDVFVEGLRENDQSKLAAISAPAKRGLKLFVGRGECRLCHSGPNFTDDEFHDTGVPPRAGLPLDQGRLAGIKQALADPFNAAGAFSDDRQGPAAQRLEFTAAGPHNLNQFKTPSLRNAALTAPYMHQGQFATLADVLGYYSTLHGSTFSNHHTETILQPRDFSPEEIADIEAFLHSLTSVSIDPALMSRPESPMAPASVAPALNARSQ